MYFDIPRNLLGAYCLSVLPTYSLSTHLDLIKASFGTNVVHTEYTIDSTIEYCTRYVFTIPHVICTLG